MRIYHDGVGVAAMLAASRAAFPARKDLKRDQTTRTVASFNRTAFPLRIVSPAAQVKFTGSQMPSARE
jgi:hypothetical protein